MSSEGYQTSGEKFCWTYSGDFTAYHGPQKAWLNNYVASDYDGICTLAGIESNGDFILYIEDGMSERDGERVTAPREEVYCMCPGWCTVSSNTPYPFYLKFLSSLPVIPTLPT